MTESSQFLTKQDSLLDQIRRLEDEKRMMHEKMEKMAAALEVKRQHEKERSLMMNDEIETLKKKLDNKISNLDDIGSKQK